ncbi:2'-5' RNA ligase [Rhodovulum iodosum]|uniref:RNA 2',3'-cyclic phosphodiesterase n=1 Tax=Rhodovulum iodosum TaxID=68291 RepID=A0ABV3XP71_9RHOB|nr:RNA 2',3'-cyclic phosphodiesterase [Rhodovulum robiginosum]RSK31577.1 RNA 2',3'-cyclic phosphodiesterase [Rhodovulum robiginosum]
MIRAFAALDIPQAQRMELMIVQQGLPVPRLVPPENLHLTLVFLGEIEESALEEVHLAWQALRMPGFEVSLRGLRGLGVFGGGKPRAVYAGAAECPGLARLQAKLEQAARGAGLTLERRRFVPHVTLARINRPLADPERLERHLAMRADFAAPPFAVDHFALYRSDLGAGGARYEELARYPLGPA